MYDLFYIKIFKLIYIYIYIYIEAIYNIYNQINKQDAIQKPTFGTRK